MDRVDVNAWLNDELEPTPELWNTREFYQAALALGLTDKETIVYTLALVDAAEEISRKSSVPYSTIVASILQAGNGIVSWRYGLQTEKKITRIIWLWRVRVWIWRWKQFQAWLKAPYQGWRLGDRLQIGSFFHLIKR
jgi:hypothetical protein